ncbi:MAG: TetR/AcrR family transcriptional regulator [Pseudomonadota bacterium]
MPKFVRRKEDRPEEIVAAAFDEFAERGYADTRLEQVAKRAGVSKGLVYLYFKTKEHLFKAVVRTVVMPRVAEFEDAIANHDGTLAEFLEGPFVRIAAALPDSPARHVVRLIIAEGPKHPDLTRWYHEQVISRVLAAFRSLFATAEERGEIRPNTLAQQPLLLIGPVVVSMLWKLLFDRHSQLDVEALIAAHVDLLLRAVEVK